MPSKRHRIEIKRKMETPMKGTRRKLKKVMKKSRANLSASTNTIYQKKLKSAINVSLNSTRTVRTLQSNNRSLATSLEKMRQDFRQVHDHYALLLEENHELREKILELQRINVSEKYIDQEVDKRVEERMEQMKRKLVLLSDIATKFLDTLAELSDICVSSKSSMLEDLSSTESANQNYSLLPSLPLIVSDVSLDSMSDFESTQSSHTAETEMEYGDYERNVVSRRNRALEMTAIMEQSMLCPPTDLSTISSKLDEVLGSFSAASYLDKKLTTKLPSRVAKHINQTETQKNDHGRKAIEELNKRRSVESPKRVTRRQTFVVANGPTDDCLITDVAIPPFLVSDYLSDNGALDINVEDKIRTPKTPTRVEQSNEITLPKGSTRLSQSSVKQSHILTPRGKEQSPRKASPLKQQVSSPKGTKSSKQRATRSRKRQMSPKSSPVSQKEKQMLKKMSTLDQKPTTVGKNRNAASPTKTVSPKPEGQQQQNFFISNEFKLINVLKDKLYRSNQISSSSVIQHKSPYKETGDHTIFPIDDMEFTRMDESVMAPFISVKQLSDDCGDATGTELAPYLAGTSSRSRSKQFELAVNDVDGSAEEKIPDAVTMRCTKPGQMMFAAARKESDGTRKNVPMVTRVRSKSKKKIAEMIENMGDTQPETIFDFHDKTPVFLNSEKQKAASVFNFSADISRLSPLTPLNKNSTRNRKSDSSANNVSSKPTSQLQSLDSGQNDLKDCILIEVSVPLKGDSPPANSTYRTRSRSVGKQQHVTENGDVEVKARSQSRKRRAKSKAGSPAKISSSSVTSSDVLSTNSSSPAPKDQGSQSRSDAADDVKDDKPIAAGHSTSGVVYKQKMEGEEDLQVNIKEIVRNRTSKSHSSKVLSKKQVCDEAERNHENEIWEGIKVISVSGSEKHIVSVMPEETEQVCLDIAPLAESDPVDFYDTNANTTSELQSDVQDIAAVVSKKKIMKGTSRKTREKSMPKSAAKNDLNDSESEFVEHTNFINTRREKTRGMKENIGYKNSETKDYEKNKTSAINNLAPIGDDAALVDVSNAAKKNLEVPEEPGQLLEQLKCLRTPAFSHGEDMQSAVVSPITGKDKNEQGLKVSRIVRGTPPGRSQPIPKRPALAHNPESEAAAGAKRRRAATNVNYAELKLNKKLRRGDPFTSHYCSGDKITIFKSPKGKKKMVKEGMLASLHNQSISEELVPI